MDEKLEAARAAIKLIFSDARPEFMPDHIEMSNEDAAFCTAIRSIALGIPADKLAILMLTALPSEAQRCARGAFEYAQRGNVTEALEHCGWRYDRNTGRYYFPEVVNGRLSFRKKT